MVSLFPRGHGREEPLGSCARCEQRHLPHPLDGGRQGPQILGRSEREVKDRDGKDFSFSNWRRIWGCDGRSYKRQRKEESQDIFRFLYDVPCFFTMYGQSWQVWAHPGTPLRTMQKSHRVEEGSMRIATPVVIVDDQPENPCMGSR